MEDDIGNQSKLKTSHKFAKNSLLNVAGFAITFPIFILLTPYMLEVLGKVRFGVWALAGVVTSYTQLSDLGMTTALVKFVAECWAKQDVERVKKIVSTVFFSFAVIGGLAAGGILLLRHFIIVRLLKVPAELYSEALFVFMGVIFIFYFNLLFSVYNSVLQGLQRMDVTNGITVVSKVLRAVGIYLFLANGFGLTGLIVNSAIFSFLTVGANVFFVEKLMPGFRVNLLLTSFPELKEIAKYSINILVARFIGLFQDPVNKFILAAYTSLPFVSFYEVGWRVKSMVHQLFSIGLIPLLPASSELHSISNKQELEGIYLSVSRMLYLFAVPFFLLVIALAEPLVQVWLGDEYKLVARAIQFLLLGNLFSLLVTPEYIILQGIGKPQINTISHIIAAAFNVGLAVMLVHYVGFYGVLIGGAISLLISSMYVDYFFRRIANIDLKTYLHQMPILSVLITIIICGILIYVIGFVNTWSFGKLTLFALGTCGVYLAVFGFAGIVGERDKRLLTGLLKLLWQSRGVS